MVSQGYGQSISFVTLLLKYQSPTASAIVCNDIFRFPHERKEVNRYIYISSSFKFLNISFTKTSSYFTAENICNAQTVIRIKYDLLAGSILSPGVHPKKGSCY